MTDFGEEDTQVRVPDQKTDETLYEVVWTQEQVGGELVLRVTPVRRDDPDRKPT